MGSKIRFIENSDINSVLDIYSPYIKSTAITFEYDVPDVMEFTARVRKITKQFPWLVYEEEGSVKGYAYASPMHERTAYQWNAELSVYLNENIQSKGIGKKLYRALIELLYAQGYQSLYSCIALPNEKSMHLHQSFGFEQAALYPKSGFKFHKWYDVVWLYRPIGSYTDNLPYPIPITDLDENVKREILERFAV